jgi:hypothetical protein
MAVFPALDSVGRVIYCARNAILLKVRTAVHGTAPCDALAGSRGADVIGVPPIRTRDRAATAEVRPTGTRKRFMTRYSTQLDEPQR